MRESGDPYARRVQTPIPGWTIGYQRGIYFYPPLMPYFHYPFTWLPLATARMVWFGLNLAMIGGFFVISLRISGSILARRWWEVAILGLLIAPPTRICLQLGQVGFLIALPLAASFLIRWRQPIVSGILLGLAILFKLFPGMLAVYYFLYRPRRAAWATGLATVVLAALPTLQYGLVPYQAFINELRITTDYPYPAEYNISLRAFWERLFLLSDFAIPVVHQPSLAHFLTLATTITVVLLCLLVSRPTTPQSDHHMQFNLWLCAMLLIAPANGYYHMMTLVLPLFSLLRYVEQHQDHTIRNWLIIATALVCIPPGWTRVSPTLYQRLHIGWGTLALTPAFYGLCIYIGMLALLTWRERNGRHDRDVTI